MNLRQKCILLWCIMGIVCYFVYPEDYGNTTKKIESITYKVKRNIIIEIPIQLHIDQSINAYFKKHSLNVKSVLKQILNQTEILLQSSTLQQKIKLKLLSHNFTINKNAVEVVSHGSMYLKNYCNYEKKIKMERNSSYYSVMITALKLYYETNGIKNWRITGRTYVNGICLIDESCAMIKWGSLNTPYLLAHEIGHSIGLNHDGSPFNKCRPKGYIMSRAHNPQKHPRVWSKCSRRSLIKKFMSEITRCLRRY